MGDGLASRAEVAGAEMKGLMKAVGKLPGHEFPDEEGDGVAGQSPLPRARSRVGC